MEIYVHTPFCVKKCKYCDFNSSANCFGSVGEYFAALKRELEIKSQRYGGEGITSIYFGGGTPTSVDVRYLTDLLTDIKRLFKVENNAEITVEANPETVDESYIKELKSGGFNRISVGVQSLDDNELKGLGRVHSADKAIECLKRAERHFDNVSADLMIGLEGQTWEKVKRSIDSLLSLNIDHISCYMLMIEEGTVLKKEVENGGYTPLNEDDTVELYDRVCGYLKANGFDRYETSNFARNGKFSRHNMGYWTLANYIGVGVSAHSLVNDRRFYNVDGIAEYILNPDRELLEEELSKEELEREYIMLALRTKNGVDRALFRAKFGADFHEKYADALDKLDKCLYITEEAVSIEEEYFSAANAIIVNFI